MKVKLFAAVVASALVVPATAAAQQAVPKVQAIASAQAIAVGAVAQEVSLMGDPRTVASRAVIDATVRRVVMTEMMRSGYASATDWYLPTKEMIQKVRDALAPSTSDPLDALANLGDILESPSTEVCNFQLGTSNRLDPCAPKHTTWYFGQEQKSGCDSAWNGNAYERTKDQDNRWFWWNTHYLHITGNRFLVCGGKMKNARVTALTASQNSIRDTYHDANDITAGYGVGGDFDRKYAGSGGCYAYDYNSDLQHVGSGGVSGMSRCWYSY